MGASAIRLCSDLFLSLVSLAICEGWFFFVSLAQSSHKALFPADLRHAQGTGSTMWERVSAHRESGDGRVDAYCGHSTQGRPANQPWHAVWGTGIPWDVAEAKTPLIDLRRGWGGCTTNKLLTSISENATLGFQHHHLLGVFEKHRLSGPTLDLKNQNLRVNWSPRSFLFAWWKSTTRLWYRSSAQLSSVHWLSSVRLFATPWTAAHQASLSVTNSQSLLKFTSIESVMPSNHLILSHPLLLLASTVPSIMVFSNESVLCIRWPKTGVSASAPVLLMNIQHCFPLGWAGWISLQSKGLSTVFCTVQNYQFFGAQPSLWSSSHISPGLLQKP